MAEASTTDKGKLLEHLVAMLHEGPGIMVRQRVTLPSRYNPECNYQIDILVTESVAGHRVQLAIECVNREAPVGSEQIDRFAGTLQQLGLAPSQGIVVTTGRFTRGALDRAQALDMKTLTFPDLTEDGLNQTVDEALQSVVFLLPEVVRFNLISDMDEPVTEIGDAFMLYDQHDAPAGTIPDFVWDAWRTGRISHEIGEHVLAFRLPDGWYNLIAGQKRLVRFVSIVVNVTGLAITIRGESRTASLVNASDGTLERFETRVEWLPSEDRYELRTLRSPEELAEYIRSEHLLHAVSRVPLPRVRFWNMMFWPPSERVAEIMEARMDAFEKGVGPDPRPFDFTELEGSDLSAVWEPIAREYVLEIQDAA